MRIVCVGFNQESLVCLKKFQKVGLPVCGLIMKEGQIEKKGSDYQDLSPFALENNIPFIQTSNINGYDVKQWLKYLDVDVVFIMGWSQLVDDEFLKIPNMYTIGSHPSKLPYGAGRAPIVWSILEEVIDSAVTFFKVVNKADAGSIVLQKEFNIPSNSNSRQLYNIVSSILANGFIEIYDQLLLNSICEIEQDMSARVVRGKRIYEDGYIDFSRMTSHQVDLLIRATTDPYPGAFTFYEKTKITIWGSEKNNTDGYKGTPGQILAKNKDRVLVQCSDRPIWIVELEFDSVDLNNDKVIIGSKFDINRGIF